MKEPNYINIRSSNKDFLCCLNHDRMVHNLRGKRFIHEVDIEGLKRCSMTEFGFVNSALRKKIWPLLLDIDSDHIINHHNAIVEHKDTDQVAKDVERSMWRFTKGKSKLRDQKRAELTRIINAILSLHPQLHYFQGYHEIGSILLLVTNETLSFAMLERLSLYHINDNMLPSFSEVSKLLSLVFPLLSLLDNQTYQFLNDSQVQSMFTISWILTWFAHNFDELENIARLYDYFLSSHPLSPLYFSVVLINHFKSNLLVLECSYDVVHSFFSTLPEDLPLDKLIKQTQQLLEKVPPKKLQEKSKISLLPESPMCTYPYQWMKAMTLKSNGGEKKPFNVYKFSFYEMENTNNTSKTIEEDYYKKQIELIEITQGAYRSRCLHLVTKLNLSALLADEKPHSVDELAKKLRVDATTLHKIMRALSTIGVFKHHDQVDGVSSRIFSQSDLSRMLNNSFTRDAILYKSGDCLYNGCSDIGETLKTGKASVGSGKGYSTIWEYFWDNPSELSLFEKGMTGLTTPLIPYFLGMADFSKFQIVVDLGGSQGILIQEILKENKNIKKGINFDVLETIENNKKLDRTNVDSRFSEVVGSFFEQVPVADCYTMSKIIHDWDVIKSKQILETIGRSIKPNGKVYIFDLILEKDRDFYTYRTWIDIDLWHSCNGRQRTEKEYQDLSSSAD
ncbi:RabGAP/TBC domain-containing protein [Cavenderia fasciculata]|uniref:RabGAP/TBC domain-containing protein n=1 Tax=Cavenderia fasciculata TaxID=261658 RepID=F4Q6N2_CACFS|nr:RabGAP/TBC domain-containing protein [Cavenderia fasciculata]EGG16542.1 RabGAP/TBC domain-containing protein [Cavenderia fasciculata]|eukprot:XP_004354942.1 RabGAP/TBC domain-containing protein [Cavenderia fasciculata]